MVGVNKAGALNALSAVVPVGAVKALVANTRDVLIAAVADGHVHAVPAGSHLDADVVRHQSARNGRSEGMHGVMAMRVGREAGLTEVKIIAFLAVEELSLGKFMETSVTGAHKSERRPVVGSHDGRLCELARWNGKRATEV